MTPRIPTTREAVAATLSCARALGLPTSDPEVVAEGYSVRVRLRPSPVISRVLTAGLVLRQEPLPWLRREVAVASFLSGAGAPVVAPWEHPGPFVVDGVPVSLWTWVEQLPEVVAQQDFGVLLADLHGVLAGYPGELPPLVGPLTDVRSALALSDDPVLHDAAARLVPAALSWSRRPLHGDAHTGNLLVTSAGPLWTDFEDVCVGPVEWDLASRTLGAEAVAAYGPGTDPRRLAECRDLRRLQTLAGLLTDDVQDGSLRDELVAALRR